MLYKTHVGLRTPYVRLHTGPMFGLHGAYVELLNAYAELHEAQVALHRAYVGLHEAFVELHKAFATPCRGTQGARNSPEPAQRNSGQGTNTV